MARNVFCKAIGMFIITVLALACSSTAFAKTIQLRYATENSTAAWFHPNYYLQWAEKVEKVTDGRVKIKIYPAGSLGSIPGFYDMVQNGIADIAFGVQNVNSGQFPLTEIANLPFLPYPSGEVASEILWKLYEKFPAIQDEYKGVKLLQLGMTEQYEILTVKKPIARLADLKGIKLRVAGAVAADATSLMGATPVSVRMGELYVAMEKRIIDGVAVPGEPVLGQIPTEKVTDVLQGNFWTASFWVAINERKWQRISPEDQQAIWQSCGSLEGSKMIGHAFDQARVAADKVLHEQKGVTISQLSPEESKELLAMGHDIHEKYLSDLERKGLPAREVYAALLQLIDEYKTKQ
ncbi:MAG: TRAP transporter substrate-binding protein [Desulfopila sp.]